MSNLIINLCFKALSQAEKGPFSMSLSVENALFVSAPCLFKILAGALAHYNGTLCLPVSSADNLGNSLDPDQARRFVGPDQGPNCLTF